MTTRPLLALPLLAAALALPVSARAETAAAAEPAPAAALALPAITVSTATPAPLTARVRASGLVEAEETIYVQPQIEGQAIERLLAEVGDTVAAGQVLAELSTSTLTLQKTQAIASRESALAAIAQAEAQLVEAQASADEAARVRDRTDALRKQGTASQASADQAASAATAAAARVTVARQGLEAARAQLALAEAQLANVDLQLSRTAIKAPTAGVITARNALQGAIASASAQPMFVLVRDGRLELVADVAEADVLRLRPGQTARLHAPGADATITGTVRLVEPAIDRATRLGRVRIAIPDASQVRPGMFLDAEIILDAHEGLSVPVTSVTSAADGSFVMRVADGVVHRQPVRTGIRDGGLVEILEGLAPGDLVVTKAAAFVRDGDRVQPVPAAAPTN